MNDDNFSQGSAAQSSALGTSPQELTLPYPSCLLQAPGVYRNNITRVSENTALPLYRLYSFKTKPALLFLGTCSWDKGSACLGACPNKEQCQAVLLLASFFLALNSSWIFPFYPTSFPICFPPCLSIILLVTSYLHQHFPFRDFPPIFCFKISALPTIRPHFLLAPDPHPSTAIFSFAIPRLPPQLSALTALGSLPHPQSSHPTRTSPSPSPFPASFP